MKNPFKNILDIFLNSKIIKSCIEKLGQKCSYMGIIRETDWGEEDMAMQYGYLYFRSVKLRAILQSDPHHHRMISNN